MDIHKDIISYQLNTNCTESLLLDVASKVYEDWMKHQDGFIKWEIHREKEDSCIDIVYWNSKEQAKASEASMKDMAHGADWFACYLPGTIASRNVKDVVKFGS